MGSRQPSRSMPANGSPSENTKPTPSLSPILGLIRITSWKGAQVARSVAEAGLFVLGSNGTLVGFPSRRTLRQRTHWSRSVNSLGTPASSELEHIFTHP